jgi:hypothetical protein
VRDRTIREHEWEVSMTAGGDERCNRCGADPFSSGEPYTCWIWTMTDGVLEEHALRMCAPCGRDFPTNLARAEYLRLVFYA